MCLRTKNNACIFLQVSRRVTTKDAPIQENQQIGLNFFILIPDRIRLLAYCGWATLAQFQFIYIETPLHVFVCSGRSICRLCHDCEIQLLLAKKFAEEFQTAVMGGLE